MSDLPYELYRAEQVRALDRTAIERFQIPGSVLMERAGAAGFRVLSERWPQARRIAVVCGTGNNAGDGYVLARQALGAGLEVSVCQVGDPGRLQGDALAAQQRLLGAGGQPAEFAPEAVRDADMVVDALLGTGVNAPLEGAWRAAVEAINSAGRPVLSLDLPSGLSADTGQAWGTAVHASCTLSFIGLKQGMFTGQGPAYCGRVLFEGLSVPADVYRTQAPAARRLDAAGTRTLLPRRARTAHKGQFGHVLVVGGERGMAGAARMAGEAAARSGAGRVTLATRAEHAAEAIIGRPELMARGVTNPTELEPLLARATVVAAGPGLGCSDWAAVLLGQVLASELPVVLDADGLNLLADGAVASTPPRGGWVLTPHPGEAARLLGTTVPEIEADRFAAVSALQARYGGVVLLKGAGTLVADGGPLAVCTQGNPGMAGGGMGDVLTGLIAGLIAQGWNLAEAAGIGVAVHAAAGDAAAAEGERGLLAGDLFPHLRELLNPRDPDAPASR